MKKTTRSNWILMSHPFTLRKNFAESWYIVIHCLCGWNCGLFRFIVLVYLYQRFSELRNICYICPFEGFVFTKRTSPHFPLSNCKNILFIFHENIRLKRENWSWYAKKNIGIWHTHTHTYLSNNSTDCSLYNFVYFKSAWN